MVRREELISVIRGEVPADLVIKGGKFVNVHTAEIYSADVSVKGDRIATVGNCDYQVEKETKVLDASGKYVTPGLIDCHFHIDGAHMTMNQLARALVSRGTTAIATDFYEVGVVSGVKGIKFFLEEASKTPLKILFVATLLAYIQNKPFGTTDSVTAEEVMELIKLPWRPFPGVFAVGLSEPSPASTKDPVIRAMMNLTLDGRKVVSGHACATYGRDLNAYVALGGSSDHESIGADEAIEKARLGMRIHIREGSSASNLDDVIKAITEHKIDTRYFMFCDDEEDPSDLEKYGHMDYKVRRAVQAGVDPITAVQMATLNAATYFKVDDEMGSVSPGKIADALIVNNLQKFDVDAVVAGGKLVACKGQYLLEVKTPTYPEFLLKTVRLKRPLLPEDFDVKVSPDRREATVRVIGARDDTLITEKKTAVLKVQNGLVLPDVENDILKIACIERNRATGKMGVGFITGFKLKGGALATSYSPTEHNIAVLGTNNHDMAFAVNSLAEVDGGHIVVKNGKVQAQLELPIVGILTDRPLEEVAEKFRSVKEAAYNLGCDFRWPFNSLAFMAHPVGIPSYKISEFGFVDVFEEKIIDVVID